MIMGNDIEESTRKNQCENDPCKCVKHLQYNKYRAYGIQHFYFKSNIVNSVCDYFFIDTITGFFSYGVI